MFFRPAARAPELVHHLQEILRPPSGWERALRWPASRRTLDSVSCGRVMVDGKKAFNSPQPEVAFHIDGGGRAVALREVCKMLSGT